MTNPSQILNPAPSMNATLLSTMTQLTVPLPAAHGRYAIRDLVQTLDPVTQHQEIGYLSICYDFPWDTTRALEFALFRTFGVAKGTPLLVKTGEFLQRTQKRYDDTVLILSEILENGYDSERGRTALRRMNQQHSRYRIPNDEYLYTLSTFIFEPIRWNARFGWRPLTDTEKHASYFFWRRIGEFMAIKDIPDSLEAFERFNVDFERAHFAYSDNNRLLGEVTRDFMIARVLPRRLTRLGEPFVYAMLDDAMCDAVGFPHPSQAMRSLVNGLMRARAVAMRGLARRTRPRLITRQRHPSYPNGYQVDELGAKP
jgi:ER-bound oxygenase mpaB/B'/Rubber oxygenase, catalytic domain